MFSIMCIILVLLSRFLNVVVGGSVLVGKKRYMIIIEKDKLVASTLQTTNNVPQIEPFCVSGQFFVKESKNIPQDCETFAREQAKYFYFRNNGCFYSPINFHGGRKRLGGGSSASIWEIVVESVGSFIVHVVQRWENFENSRIDSKKASIGSELSPLVSSFNFWTSANFDEVGNIAAQMVAEETIWQGSLYD